MMHNKNTSSTYKKAPSKKDLRLQEINKYYPKDEPPLVNPFLIKPRYIRTVDGMQQIDEDNQEKLKKKKIFVDTDYTDYNQLGFRTQSRVLAMQALYAMDNGNNDSTRALLRFSWADSLFEKRSQHTYAFASKLVKGTLRNLAIIDEHITNNLSGWSFDRLALVNKAILRISIFALLWLEKEIDCFVTINEAVNLAKWFGDAGAYPFTNGILQTIHEKATAEK